MAKFSKSVLILEAPDQTVRVELCSVSASRLSGPPEGESGPGGQYHGRGPEDASVCVPSGRHSAHFFCYNVRVTIPNLPALPKGIIPSGGLCQELT